MTAVGIMSLGVPPSQNTAEIREYRCLFTHDLRRKAKRWQDGFLSYHLFNNRIIVYDDSRNRIGDAYWRKDFEFGEGEELQLQQCVLVQVEEKLGDREQDITGVIASRDTSRPTPKAAPIRTPARHAGGVAKTGLVGSGSETAVVGMVPGRRAKSLKEMLPKTPMGSFGRARILESPYEQRRKTSPNFMADRQPVIMCEVPGVRTNGMPENSPRPKKPQRTDAGRETPRTPQRATIAGQGTKYGRSQAAKVADDVTAAQAPSPIMIESDEESVEYTPMRPLPSPRQKTAGSRTDVAASGLHPAPWTAKARPKPTTEGEPPPKKARNAVGNGLEARKQRGIAQDNNGQQDEKRREQERDRVKEKERAELNRQEEEKMQEEQQKQEEDRRRKEERRRAKEKMQEEKRQQEGKNKKEEKQRSLDAEREEITVRVLEKENFPTQGSSISRTATDLSSRRSNVLRERPANVLRSARTQPRKKLMYRDLLPANFVSRRTKPQSVPHDSSRNLTPTALDMHTADNEPVDLVSRESPSPRRNGDFQTSDDPEPQPVPDGNTVSEQRNPVTRPRHLQRRNVSPPAAPDSALLEEIALDDDGQFLIDIAIDGEDDAPALAELDQALAASARQQALQSASATARVANAGPRAPSGGPSLASVIAGVNANASAYMNPSSVDARDIVNANAKSNAQAAGKVAERSPRNGPLQRIRTEPALDSPQAQLRRRSPLKKTTSDTGAGRGAAANNGPPVPEIALDGGKGPWSREAFDLFGWRVGDSKKVKTRIRLQGSPY